MAHQNILPAAGSQVLQQIKKSSDEGRLARGISPHEFSILRAAFRTGVRLF